MPRVRFLTPVATEKRSYHPGDTADVPGPLASAWAKGGNAEIVRGEESPVDTPEGTKRTATKRASRGRAAKKAEAATSETAKVEGAEPTENQSQD